MTEIEELLSEVDTGSKLREFALVYQTLSDFVANCPRPDWILYVFKQVLRRPRTTSAEQFERCAETLEKYIEALSEQIDDINEQGREWARQSYFNYKPGVRQIKKEHESGKLSLFEASRRRLIWLLIVAHEATRYILEDKVARFHFDNCFEQIVSNEITAVTEAEEIEFRRSVLKDQADLLRWSLGNQARPLSATM